MLLGGCAVWPAHARKPTASEERGIAAVSVLWGEEPCDEVLVAQEEFPAEYCLQDSKSCLASLNSEPWPVLMWARQKHVIIVDSSLTEKDVQTAVIHESIHLMVWCSTAIHQYDFSHVHPGLWELRGVRDSLEQRAQNLARNGR